MKLVTVATNNNRYYPYLKLSAERYGHELITLGWGQKWQGFTWRFKLIREYLKTCQDNDIICIIDGYDVLILEGPTEIENKFKKICGKDKSKVLISKETFTQNNISSEIHRSSHYIAFTKCKDYYICAGTYIGYAKTLTNMYIEICNKYDCADNADDQILIQSYCNDTESSFNIDINNEIFLVLGDSLHGLSNGTNNIKIK